MRFTSHMPRQTDPHPRSRSIGIPKGIGWKPDAFILSPLNSENDKFNKICISSNLNSKRNKVVKNDKLYYLDEINSDIIGPINPPSLGGSKYIVTFLDSITKYLKIEILSNKSNAFISYKKFELRAKNSVNNNSNILKFKVR